MPWITENDKEYWLPEVFPEPTDEYQQEQSEKLYLTHENKERRHPGWTYADNNAYVDDEYLFQNEGWKVVIDNYEPASYEDDLKKVIKNPPDQWEELDEKTLLVTYNFIDFTQEEIDAYIEKKWIKLRTERDLRLSETDWIITRAMEENLTVSSEVTLYRQQLRDLPNTIEDIVLFKLDDNTLWPVKPEVYFGV